MSPKPCKKCGCIPSRKVVCTSRRDKRTGRVIHAQPGHVFCFFVCGCQPV